MGHMIICILQTTLYFKAVTRIVTEDNSEVSNHACLFLPYYADASWLENALKVDQSFFPHKSDKRVCVSSTKYKSYKNRYTQEMQI